MHKEEIKSIDKFFLVSNQPLFESLSDKEKTFIANRSQVIEYNKDDIIYEQGQKRNFLYIIISGRVSLLHPASKTPNNEETVIEVIRKGDYFGLISLLTGRPHSFTAKVINDARLIRIDYKSFKEILDKIPTLALHFSKVLSRRLKGKYGGVREIFQSTILSVYCDVDENYGFNYATSLAWSIGKESGRKVMVLAINRRIAKVRPLGRIKIKDFHIDNPKDILPILDDFTGNHHFVIAVLPSILDKVTEKVLKQSDLCHLIFDDDAKAIDKIYNFLKRVSKDSLKILIREKNEKSYMARYIKSGKTLPQRIYATLPPQKNDFYKVIRRISRQTTGVLIGLALGSGGAFGLAQIGVLEVLEKEKIPIDVISGTSIGALIGALWVSGYNGSEIKKITSELDTRLKLWRLVDITFPKRGFLTGRSVRNFLVRYLGDRTFYNVKVAFRVVASDIARREEVIISSGKLLDAVMASVAIPGVFNPYVTEEGHLLVDGGVVNPVPISVLSREGVKRIIAVNSLPSPEDISGASKRKQNILDIIANSLYSMEYRIAKYACQEADVYLHPILQDASWYEFHRSEEFIELGRKEAHQAMPKIKKLIKKI